MVQQLQIDTALELSGKIVGISFANPENGFCCFSLSSEPHAPTIRATGILPEVKEGLDVRLKGYWKVHARWGKQFEFTIYDVPDPSTEETTVAYLSTLRGCGPAIAQRLWDKFGPEVIAILESSHEKLLEVNGIGQKTLPKIKESFETTRALRHLIGFLGELGVGAGYATRIYNHYGDGAISQIKRNPYILAEEVRGFGFKKADELARSIGIEEDSFVRIRAAILHVLKEAASKNGHCYLPQSKLETATAEALTLPGFRPQASQMESVLGQIILKQELVRYEDTLWLPDLWNAEEALAGHIKVLAGEVAMPTIFKEGSPISLNDFIADFCDRHHALHALQEKAIRVAANQGFSILTGGPGTGKSSTSRAIVELWHAMNKRVVVLAAPSGKAAKRLGEATGGCTAKTIHRLLEWQGGKFKRNRSNPLDGYAFLIDESSMVNLKLFEALLQAIPRHAVVVIVGDVDQLAAIGAGSVLRDLIESKQVPVTQLTHIYRQSENSTIAHHCQSVARGELPLFERMNKVDIPRQDCVFLQVQRAHITKAIRWLIAERLPQLGYGAEEVQIIAPIKSGDYGCKAINELAQEVWNPKTRSMQEVKDIREGDRVIQLRNDYDKLVFNGDMGMVSSVNRQDQEIQTLFDDVGELRSVAHQFREVSDLALAYALTVHKSQGSEFPVTIIPVTMAHYIMLHRNLLFTAMSRAKRFLVLVGEFNAIQHAVRTVRAGDRNTMLQQRLVA